MLLLKSFKKIQIGQYCQVSAWRAAPFIFCSLSLRIHRDDSWFVTIILAHMLDSLVRVTRRADEIRRSPTSWARWRCPQHHDRASQPKQEHSRTPYELGEPPVARLVTTRRTGFSLFARSFPTGGAPHALPRRDATVQKKAATSRIPKVRREERERAPSNRLGTNIWCVFDIAATMLVEHRSRPKNGQSGRPTQPGSTMKQIKRRQPASCVRTSRALWSGNAMLIVGFYHFPLNNFKHF